ncbi:(S)-benzoin forming benzil reductase [Virgibacillus kekensis]|uniref:(S)-benzoin forming benzil reductase n=1 Tax=Virgibacillus kekensis TaxID=202261 RepID=A0ABV9DM06_9BACI
MRFAIITGVSKGLGEAAAKIFMESGIHVVGVSRSNNETLEKYASEHDVTFQHVSCDLGDPRKTEDAFTQISRDILSRKPSTVYLINNAAVLEPIGKSMAIKGSDLAYHVQVNTVAPMIITNLFLQHATELDIPLISTTITSGAAERPMYGWSAYCSTKASINMYTQTAALEQDQLKTQNKVIAFSPGVMDTNMQEKIRSTSKNEFADVEKFKEYKEKNMLKSPDTVAGVLVDILTDETGIINGKIYSVKDYL